MLPAKAFGMKVTQYFVGFGRTVWSTKRGETEYGIKLIPAGGFVRIIGMMPPAKGEDPSKVRKANTGPIQSMVENARTAEYETIDPADNGRLFYQKVWWKKLIVMASGPLVNVAIAFVLFSGLFMLYGANVAQTTVATVTDCVHPGRRRRPPIASASRATRCRRPRRPGSRSATRSCPSTAPRSASWDQLTPLIRANTDKPATIVVERNGQQATLQTNTILNQVRGEGRVGQVRLGRLPRRLAGAEGRAAGLRLRRRQDGRADCRHGQGARQLPGEAGRRGQVDRRRRARPGQPDERGRRQPGRR